MECPCVSGMMGNSCGNFRSTLSPVNAIHAAGPPFSHGQFLLGKTQPSTLRGPEEQSRSLSAMQLQMKIGSPQNLLSSGKSPLQESGLALDVQEQRGRRPLGVHRMNVMIHSTENELQSFHVALLPERALPQPITIQGRHAVRVVKLGSANSPGKWARQSRFGKIRWPSLLYVTTRRIGGNDVRTSGAPRGRDVVLEVAYGKQALTQLFG